MANSWQPCSEQLENWQILDVPIWSELFCQSAHVYLNRNRNTLKLTHKVLARESLRELQYRASHKNLVDLESLLLVFSRILAVPGVSAVSHKLLVHSWWRKKKKSAPAIHNLNQQMCHRFLSKATQHDKHKCTNTMWWYPKRIPIPVLYGQLDLLISNGDILLASLPFSTSLLSLFWWLWDLWIRSSYRIIPHSDIIRLVAFTIENG